MTGTLAGTGFIKSGVLLMWALWMTLAAVYTLPGEGLALAALGVLLLQVEIARSVQECLNSPASRTDLHIPTCTFQVRRSFS